MVSVCVCFDVQTPIWYILNIIYELCCLVGKWIKIPIEMNMNTIQRHFKIKWKKEQQQKNQPNNNNNNWTNNSNDNTTQHTFKRNEEFVILIWFIKCLQSKYICMMKNTIFGL